MDHNESNVTQLGQNLNHVLDQEAPELPSARYKQAVLFYPHDLKTGFFFKQIEVVSEFKLLEIMLDESL